LASQVADKNRVIAKLADAVKNYYQTIRALPDSTNKIAKGVALGVAFDFLPIPIISIPLAYLAARLLQGNPVAAVCTVIFFKLAVPFFYFLDFLTGQLLFGGIVGPMLELKIEGNNIITEHLAKIVANGYPFLFGSLVNAVAAYWVVYLLLKRLLDRKLLNVKQVKGV
jgi:uncharacterized protein (DUF2062 family)